MSAKLSKEFLKKLEDFAILTLEKDGWKVISISPDMTILEKDGEELKLLNVYEWFW